MQKTVIVEIRPAVEGIERGLGILDLECAGQGGFSLDLATNYIHS
jgi:hypothetical protein